MNPKRLLLAIPAAFIFVAASDFLIHGLWLKPDYAATASLWRTDSDMQAHMGWMFASQFLAALTFVIIWARGFAERACVKCAIMYGLCMALFSQATTLATYTVTPLPGELAAKWFGSAIVQGILLGLLTFAIYKPASAKTASE